MKKNIIILSFVLFGISISSCRKIYTCSCSIEDETVITTFNNEMKKNVESYCDQTERAAKIETPTATCKVEEAINQQQ